MLKRLTGLYSSIAIQLLGVLLILAVAELAVRMLMPHITPIDINARTLVSAPGQEPIFQTHPFAAFTWIPNASFGRQHVSSAGFVSTREIPFQKAANEIRIVTLGGSSTVGNGNTDTDTYPRVLESLLQQRYPDKRITVFNAAAGGYSTIESLGYLQSRMIHFHPDIVIVMHAWNDMYYFALSDQELSRWRNDFNLQAMWDNKADIRQQDPLPADVRYLSWSQLYLHLREWLRHRQSAIETSRTTLEKRFDHVHREGDQLMITAKGVNENALALYESNLRQIRNICQTRSIDCYSILQPTLFSAQADRNSPKVQQAVVQGALYHGYDFDVHVSLFNDLYAIQRRVFDDHVIDATGMNGKEALFFDHIHQSPAGTHELARLVADSLSRTNALLQKDSVDAE